MCSMLTALNSLGTSLTQSRVQAAPGIAQRLMFQKKWKDIVGRFCFDYTLQDLTGFLQHPDVSSGTLRILQVWSRIKLSISIIFTFQKWQNHRDVEDESDETLRYVFHEPPYRDFLWNLGIQWNFMGFDGMRQ